MKKRRRRDKSSQLPLHSQLQPHGPGPIGNRHSSMASKTVKFNWEGGHDSYLDHQREDSGVGSFSDSESRTAYPDRGHGSDYDTDPYALLAAETTKKEQWVEKAHKLDELLIRAHKELRETLARQRALEDHIEELKEVETKLSTRVTQLETENERLRDDAKSGKGIRTSSRRSNDELTPPSSTRSSLRSSRRSDAASKSERDEIENERDRIAKEMQRERAREMEKERERDMDRLRKRFADAASNDDDSGVSMSSSKSRQGRGSYVEPLGSVAPWPQIRVPGLVNDIQESPKRPSYPSYSQSPNLAGVTASLRLAATMLKGAETAGKLTSNAESNVVDSDIVDTPISRVDDVPEPGESSTLDTLNVPDTPSPEEIEVIAASSQSVGDAVHQVGVDEGDESDEAAHRLSELSLDNQQDHESEPTQVADSRPSSPWQEIGNVETERPIAVATAWMIQRFGDQARELQDGTDNSLGTSVISSESSTDPAEGVVSCASGGSSGSESGSFVEASASGPNTAPSNAANNRPSSKRVRNSNSQGEGNDDNDDEPSWKRISLATSQDRMLRLRFACPYQKFDPLGSPFCFMPSTKNPEGGADTFARIKSHIFRSHDPFTRCPSCWKACKTEEEAQEHRNATQCIPKASPGKYWVSREQCDQGRGQKFVANSVDNWFCLFNILLPNAPLHDHNSRRTVSPYYALAQSSHRPALNWGVPEAGSGSTGEASVARPSYGHATPQATPPRQTFPSQTAAPQPGSPSPTPLPTADFDFANILSDFDGGPALNSFFMQESFDSFSSNMDTGTSSASISYNRGTAITPAPAPAPSQIPSPPPSGGHSPPSSDRSSDANSPQPFLRRVNEHLRADNAALQDEVEILRRKHARLEGQLDELRGQLRPLNETLEGLLYLPAVQQGEEQVMNRLFGALEQVSAFKRVLNSCQNGGVDVLR